MSELNEAIRPGIGSTRSGGKVHATVDPPRALCGALLKEVEREFSFFDLPGMLRCGRCVAVGLARDLNAP